MSQRDQASHSHRSAPNTEEGPAITRSEANEEILADIDALLDEIDDVLETNAEEFVAAFVQKGGQ